MTRKSSCVNARGIPIAAYQVLPEVGYPPPPIRVSPPGQVRWGRGYLGWCKPHPPIWVPPDQVRWGVT